MASLNVFIDGTWMFKVVAAGGSLAKATESPQSRFPLDFAKLNDALLRHIRENGKACDAIGDLVICTSIFALPPDFDAWPNRFPDITQDNVERMKKNLYAREQFVRDAAGGGYSDQAVYRPLLREWTLKRLMRGEYHEKQVDTTVVALLVRSAITRGEDFHTVITGDSDILPAVSTAYPEFTRNVFVTTTHPDELNAGHRQTAYSLIDFRFDIPPFYMQDNTQKLLKGEHVYRCVECGKVFAPPKEFTHRERPRCRNCTPPRPAVAAR